MRDIKKLFILAGIILMCGCTSEKENYLSETEIISLCEEIIGISSHTLDIEPENITPDCLDSVMRNHTVSVDYDSLNLDVSYLYDEKQKEYVCVCSCAFIFEDTLNTWDETYRITFTYDATQNTISSAEVYNYAKYLE